MKPDFSVFIAVARHLSFRQAGEELGTSASAVSHAIRLLEQHLQLRLLNRTTRSVSLTEAGQKLYERLRPAFEDIALTLDELNSYRESPIGTVRINAVRQGARLYLVPLAAEFMRQYPDIRIEITVDDHLVDIVSGQFDAGLRLNNIIEKDMIAIPVGPPVRYAVVATPGYFAQNPAPQTPADLTGHSCIAFRYPGGRSYHWAFHRDGQKADVAVKGSLTVDDLDLALDFVLQGSGIGYLLHEQVKELIRNGALTAVLEEWLPAQPGFYLYYSDRKYMPFGLRTFIDFIKEKTQPAP
jgi:DNA-binding transcriptional LysR family regulator